MTFNNETINKALRDAILLSNPSLSVVRAQQNAPKPNGGPLASVMVALLPSPGWAELKLTNRTEDDDIDERISELVHLRASINFYGNSVPSYADPGIVSSLDEAVKFKTYLQGTSATQHLDSAGLGLLRFSEVRNLSALEDNEWEERAQVDVELSVVSDRTDLIYAIKSVLVTGEYQEWSNLYPATVLIDENSG